jgi:hypothetical protein
VQRDIEDPREKRDSAEGVPVSIGAPRLRSLGAELPETVSDPGHKLYFLLANELRDGAHSAYNALVCRPVAFEGAASRALSTSGRLEA